MVKAINVGVGSCDNLRLDGSVDIAGLAEVVPRYDLNEVGQKSECLLPASKPERVTGRVPVLLVNREI
jgi:hypothetical protein